MISAALRPGGAEIAEKSDRDGPMQLFSELRRVRLLNEALALCPSASLRLFRESV